MIPLYVPLDPSPDEARDWLGRELTRPEYLADRDWLAELLRMLRLSSTSGNDGSSLVGTWVATGLLVTLAVAVLWWVVRARWVAKAKPDAHDELVDPTVSPEDYRAQAELAWASGDWDAVVIAGFRSLVSNLDRRQVLGNRPGRTTREVSASIAEAYPGVRDQVLGVASAFDHAAYGMTPSPRASRDQAQATLDLERHLRSVPRPAGQGASA